MPFVRSCPSALHHAQELSTLVHDSCAAARGIDTDMPNPSKNKGDLGERQAVAWLAEHPVYSELIDVPKAARMKAAGIPEDVGDIRVFMDTAIQVKNWKMASLGAAVREAAIGARAQADNGFLPLAVGMTKVPGARASTVQWLASTLPADWPGGTAEHVMQFGTISKALVWLRDDDGPAGYRTWPRTERIALLVSGSARPVVLAPMEAWLAALSRYRAAKASLSAAA